MNKTEYNLAHFVHGRNSLGEPLCGFKGSKMLVSDSEDEMVTCPSCRIHKQFHRSQPK